MQIYEGTPRQDYEEVLRSIGAFVDQGGMREISLAETAQGFLLQALGPQAENGQSWSDAVGRIEKVSYLLAEEDIARFMDEASNRRNRGRPPPQEVPDSFYEHALRVLGHYIDEQKPRDVMLFEQDRAFVLRLLTATRSGLRHVLAEFTREEIESLIEGAHRLRGKTGGESILDTVGG
ncbi:MAG TPA: hypothetical protein VM305_08515 [Candidatus Limnocylindrales bacterium]|nr:hypothetical protein [Candidatus Limnocylindrales bacterium]